MGRLPKNHIAKGDNVVIDVDDDSVPRETEFVFTNDLDVVPNEVPVVQSAIKTGFKVFKLANTKKKGAVTLICVDDVYNPTTKKMERIRVLRGVESIWMKDQKDIDPAYIRSNQVWMRFENKMCRVGEMDTQLLEFCKLTVNNIEAPNRRTGGLHEFFEWNPARQAEAANKLRQQKIDAMTKAIGLPLSEVRKFALYFGILMTDEVGYPKVDETLKNDLVGKAEENPAKFLEALNDKMVNISYYIKRAVADNRIDVGRASNTIYWADGGLICHYPQDRAAVDFLVEFASLPTQESQQFLKRLEQISV